MSSRVHLAESNVLPWRPGRQRAEVVQTDRRSTETLLRQQCDWDSESNRQVVIGACHLSLQLHAVFRIAYDNGDYLCAQTNLYANFTRNAYNRNINIS